MAVESSRTIGPAAGAAASGLDLSSLSAGRQLEARVTALAGQMATMASRHGTLEVDLGKAKVAVGDVLRFEVQAVPGGDGKSGIRLELLPSEQQTATQATTAPAVDPARAALGRAVARAVTTQSGLAPLYGALTGLANAPADSVPDPIRSIVDQILDGRLAASGPVSAASVAAAFRNSGLFSESTRAAAGGAATPAGDQDLKTAFTALRDALAKWVGNAGPAAASGASGGASTTTPTTTPTTPGNAAAGQAGAAAGRPATGEMPASSSGLAVRAAYGGAAQAASAQAQAQAQTQTQTAGQTQTAAAAPGQIATRPAATPDAQPDGRGRLAAAAYGVPSAAARVAVPPSATPGVTVSTASTGQTAGVAPTPQAAVPTTASPMPSAASAAAPSVTTIPAAQTPPPATPGAATTAAVPVGTEAPAMPATPTAAPQVATTTTAPQPSPPSAAVPAGEAAAPNAAGANVATTTASASPATPAASTGVGVPQTTAAATPGTAPVPAGPGAAHGPVAIAGPSGGVMLIREGAQPPAEGAAKPTGAANAGVVVPPVAEGEEQALAAAFRLVRAVAADLGLAEGAADEAAALGAGIAASPRERAGKIPPPRKGALPIAQDPAVGERADTAEAAEQLGRKTLERADGALQRILLEQWAVLDTSGEAAASVQRGGKEWTAELPLATRDGTSIVQMTVERDGKQGGTAGEAAKVGWRVRFALDVEPIGPVHAQIGLSGEHLSVGLWIERPEMAEKLAADIGSLTSALSDGGSVLEAVHVAAGEPPATRAEAQSSSGHFIDVSL